MSQTPESERMFSLSTFLLTFACALPNAAQEDQAVAVAAQEPAVVAEVSSAAQDEAPSISHEERQKRTFIYSTGSRYILQLVLDGVLEAEIARRKEAKVYVGKHDFTEEEVQAEVQRRIDMVAEQDPNADFWGMVMAQGFTQSTFAQELRRGMVAKEMFFPDDPSNWPVEQIKEILGDQWEGYLKADYEKLLAQKEAGEVTPLNEQMLNNFLMPGVWAYLRKTGEITQPSDGLPEGLCLVVNGKEFRTDDVMAQVEPMLSDTDRKWSTTFLSNLEKLEVALKASKNYMSSEEFEQFFIEEGKVYEGTIISHEMMVLQFLGFPSMEVYREYLQARQSYKNSLPADDSEEYLTMLDDMISKRGTFYGAGKVKAEVLLISAREKSSGKFRMEGDPFVGAAERAEEVRQILADGESFDTVLDEYSDYPDKVPNSAASMPQPNRGRFQSLSRNDLRGFLLENDYTDFLFGYSVSDDIFFRAEIGGIYGPIRGPLGYYFYRVVSRDAPTKEIDLMNDPNAQWMVNDDLLGQAFIEHINTLRKDA
ncbi:MAG: hypothetical protein GY747_05590 [Planctomycetes bacterium]|nr:hypothetical protein [Planctomycetota bacterium]MCP4770408.1 hypothetical protein [Planctomycetota bacterium]MCP4860500.1 hypothetical protein [Planctomycetota bacterium]